jgi:hypothetical protein
MTAEEFLGRRVWLGENRGRGKMATRKRLPASLRCRWVKQPRNPNGSTWKCSACQCWTANPDKGMCPAKNRRRRGVVGRRFTDR